MNRNRPAGVASRGNALKAPGEPRIGVAAPSTKDVRQWLPSSRYRHPGDVMRLVVGVWVLVVAAVVAGLLPGLLRPSAAAVAGVGAGSGAGRVLTGLVQVSVVAAVLVLVVAALRYRRFRVLATVAGGFVVAVALMAGISYLAGPGGSAGLPAGGWAFAKTRVAERSAGSRILRRRVVITWPLSC